jgi:hypothetical protein
MSDTQQGPDWWLGADGKWYPPVAAAAPSAEVGEAEATGAPSAEVGEADAAPTGTKRSKTPFIIGAVVVAVVAVAIGVVALSGGSSSKHTINGTLDLIGYRGTDTGGSTPGLGAKCAGHGGYSDLEDGTQVTVKDGAGTLLATGTLSNGKTTNPSTCSWTFTIAVPESGFYSIEVSHRGALTFMSSSERAWALSTSIGS